MGLTSRRPSRGARGTSNRNQRGGSADRRLRREFLISVHGIFRDHLVIVPCHHCGTFLFPADFEIDRWPVCGAHGGKYSLDNVVPACSSCNKRGPSRCCSLASE